MGQPVIDLNADLGERFGAWLVPRSHPGAVRPGQRARFAISRR